ncbi:hypothetical protein ACLGIH_20340 [Streptomyces sp. HMX87]|uniref:hypothetical protein n=1 Tax=Streptomyces sp. HMX87 TaxID=3390849 RepID=UPI003A8B6083
MSEDVRQSNSPVILRPQEPCPRCAKLITVAQDPDRQRSGDAGAALSQLIEHHIADHGTTADPLPGCPECTRKKLTENHSALMAHWARTHYVMHTLGILSEPGRYLRFADQPDPRT